MDPQSQEAAITSADESELSAPARDAVVLGVGGVVVLSRDGTVTPLTDQGETMFMSELMHPDQRHTMPRITDGNHIFLPEVMHPIRCPE